MRQVFAHYSNPRLALDCTFQGPVTAGISDQPSITLGDFKRGLDANSPTVSGKIIMDSPSTQRDSDLSFELDQAFEKNEEKRFIKSVEQALKLIDEGRYEKIVLSRRKKAKLKSSGVHDPRAWMQKYFNSQFYGHQFLWNYQDELYLSLTPESLFEKTHDQLLIDALAGTTARAELEEEDQKLWLELQQNPKERHEHECVQQDIMERLEALSIKGDWVKLFEPLKLKHVQHIHSQLQASIKDNPLIDEQRLVQILHPTAAVGTRPAQKAQELLYELEGYERGAYAAPHMIRLADRSLVIVGLRCCHVQDDEVTLYAGAGIVKGSDPQREWLETERKCRNFL